MDDKTHKSNNKSPLRVMGVLFIGLCFFWTLVFLYSVHSAMPHNAIQLPFSEELKIKAFLTQGWKFFTRNPREEDTNLYAKGIDNKWYALIEPNASSSNLFGISRKGRAKGVEMGMLAVSLKDSEAVWVDCKESLQLCADNTPAKGIVVNNSPNPQLCGELIFQRKTPVPWAWSGAKKEVIMPSKIMRTNILCQN